MRKALSKTLPLSSNAINTRFARRFLLDYRLGSIILSLRIWFHICRETAFRVRQTAG